MDKLHGALDLLVLRTLQRGALHGYGIVNQIQQVSAGVLDVEEGSLYPALHRMEQQGWVSAEWRVSENNRKAKYYKLTAAGRRYLDREAERWTRTAEAIGKVLQPA